jgi:integrase
MAADLAHKADALHPAPGATLLTIRLHRRRRLWRRSQIGEGWQVHDAAGRRKYLSSDDRSRFLRAADSLSVRSRSLCHVLAYAGCRVSEALALTLHHVDAERFTVTVRTLKRRKPIYRGRARATGGYRDAQPPADRRKWPVLADAPGHGCDPAWKIDPC